MGKHGGLQGKARRIHAERRAMRLYSRQLLEEYFEPEAHSLKPTRFIPVRSRAEFLPTLSVATDSEINAPVAIGKQMELPLVAKVDMKTDTHRAPKSPVLRSKMYEPRVLPFPIAEKTSDPNLEQSSKQTCIVLAKNAQNSGVNIRRSSKTRPFNVKDFLSGCAIGTAAAAAILTTLWVFIN